MEPARRESDICTLIMPSATLIFAAPVAGSSESRESRELVLPDTNVHDDSRAASPAASLAESEWTTVGKPIAKPAAFTRLNQIKEAFPVIWRELPSKTSDKLYAIETFGKKLREMGGDRTKVAAHLLVALKSSPAWTVQTAANKDEVARILVHA